MPHALFVAYEFPPMNDSGVARTVSFIRYLDELGWRVSVLTVTHDESALAQRDEKLAANLPQSCRVYRARCLDLYGVYRFFGGRKEKGSHEGSPAAGPGGSASVATRVRRLVDALLVPDTKIGWYPAAVTLGSQIIADDPPDLVFSTSPRETAHLIAARLGQKCKLPWVADFRDPWIGAFFAPRRPALPKYLNLRLERRVALRASRITTAWEGIRSALVRRHEELDGDRVHTITNGFEEEEFRQLTPKQFDRFSIVYTGRFDKAYRTPGALFGGLARLFDTEPGLRDKISVVIVGPVQDFVRAEVDEFKLADVVRFMGHVSQEEARAYMVGADVLFFQNIDSDSDESEDLVPPRDCIPGKLFDYIATCRPILAEVQHESDSWKILQHVDSVFWLDATDQESVSNLVRDMYATLASRNDAPTEVPDELRRYRRRALTRDLVNVFDQALVEPLRH